MSKHQIYEVLLGIFPVGLVGKSYIIRKENNSITIENWDRTFINEHFIITFHKGRKLTLTCYYYSLDQKLTTFTVRNFARFFEFGAKGRLSTYSIHKIKIIKGLGFDYKTVKKAYIDTYSDSNNYFYRSFLYRIQSWIHETWIELR